MDLTLEALDRADAAWTLAPSDRERRRRRWVGPALALGNGFLGLRAAASPWPGLANTQAPQILVAGLFGSDPGAGGLPKLTGVPDGLSLSVLVDGAPPRWPTAGDAGWVQRLDMRRGLLVERWGDLDNAAGVRIQTLRFVSMADRRLDVLRIELESASECEIVLEGRWRETASPLVRERWTGDVGLWRAEGSGFRLARVTETRLSIDGREAPPSSWDAAAWRWRWRSRPGRPVLLEQVSGYGRSDAAGPDPLDGASAAIDRARRVGWSRVLVEHQAAWAARWAASEVEVGGDAEAQKALRFAAYHLNAAANPDDPQVSVGARGLTGDDYFGHVFWDTEVFLQPFYITTWPQAARALLMYRHRALDAARAKAARLGWRGAFYAWESADTGDEAAPSQALDATGAEVGIPAGRDEVHISADVAWAVWRYWRATSDEVFLREAGAEILLETARFWASRARPEADGRFHIRGVEGPDEYHEHVDDNAFTNGMARWNLLHAVEVAKMVEGRWPQAWSTLTARLALGADELAAWRTVAESLLTGLDPKTGVYEQFAGFFDLERIDLEPYADRHEPMDVVLGRERVARSQVIKQADVVQLQAMLPELFDQPSGLANFGTYEPRCAHGSSLSVAAHGLVAARLGLIRKALDYFRRAAATDLEPDDERDEGGVHLATLGGLWQTAVCGFGGLSMTDDMLCFEPRLPPGWTHLTFPVQWRGRSLRIAVEPGLFTATLNAGEPLAIEVEGAAYDVGHGPALQVVLRPVLETTS